MQPIVFPAPMRAKGGGKPFTSPDWLYQLKIDGHRSMASVHGGVADLRTKNGSVCTNYYPDAAEALKAVRGGPHLFDGELAVLDELGRSDFNAMHKRAAHRRWYSGCARVTYCAFDLLVQDGKSVMGLPLEERLHRLKHLLKDAPGVLFVGELPAQAELFAQAVLPLKLEGFMAKRRKSIYRPGEISSDWLKIKRPGWQEGRVWVGRRSG